MADELASVTNPDNTSTTYGYDADGRKTSEAVRPVTRLSTAMTFAARLATVTDPAGAVTTSAYYLPEAVQFRTAGAAQFGIRFFSNDGGSSAIWPLPERDIPRWQREVIMGASAAEQPQRHRRVTDQSRRHVLRGYSGSKVRVAWRRASVFRPPTSASWCVCHGPNSE